jgi:hypothetical protein
MTRAASPAMSDKSQANKLGAILLSKGLALNAAMIKPGWFVIFWPFDTITSDTKLYHIMEDKILRSEPA